MEQTKALVLASNNKGKLREFNALFGAAGVRVVAQGELNVTECEEPFETFLENALAKARNASRQTGLPAMADDSGITAHALVTEPGVHSARYACERSGEAKDDAANNAKLVSRLADKADKSAHYTCVLVAVRSPDDPDPIVVEGCWYGEIVAEPRGNGGFGYDPHFYVPAFGKTAAELTAEEKNAISHRGIAMRRLADELKERWGW